MYYIKSFLVCFILIFFAKASIAVIYEESEDVIAFNKKMALLVQDYKIDNLFKEHHLLQNWDEYYTVQHTYSIAKVEKKHEQAIPYLLYAENYWHPDSVLELWKIANERDKHVSKEVCQQLKQKFDEQNIDSQAFNLMYKAYKSTHEINIKALRIESRPFWSRFISFTQKSVTSWLHQETKKPMIGISSKDLMPEKVEDSSPTTPTQHEDLQPFLWINNQKVKIQ